MFGKSAKGMGQRDGGLLVSRESESGVLLSTTSQARRCFGGIFGFPLFALNHDFQKSSDVSFWGDV